MGDLEVEGGGGAVYGERAVKVNGIETGLYVFDSSGANRALELIGKHLKVFGDGVMRRRSWELR